MSEETKEAVRVAVVGYVGDLSDSLDIEETSECLTSIERYYLAKAELEIAYSIGHKKKVKINSSYQKGKVNFNGQVYSIEQFEVYALEYANLSK